MLLAEAFSSSMASSQHPHATSQVAEKVMRRIEIAKVARNLHDCLAFASFKAQNGWQDRTLKSLEPEISEKLKRKRHFSEEDLSSDASDISAEDFALANANPSSNNRFARPSTATFKVPDKEYTFSRKRVRSQSTTAVEHLSQPGDWKEESPLVHSSPISSGPDHSTFEITRHPSQEDSPMFDAQSDDEDRDTHMDTFAQEASSSIMSSSPPRTPPPTRRLQAPSKHSGADLLLYLANSPSRSPAVNVAHISSSSKNPPSTPPSQHSGLPSDVMNTPTLGLFNGQLQTPGQNFNFADFCNVTPSPAQAHWGGRTPGLTRQDASKTPGRFARRGLNFDSLAPPTSDSNYALRRSSPDPASRGLALQLGDDLLPSS